MLLARFRKRMSGRRMDRWSSSSSLGIPLTCEVRERKRRIKCEEERNVVVVAAQLTIQQRKEGAMELLEVALSIEKQRNALAPRVAGCVDALNNNQLKGEY